MTPYKIAIDGFICFFVLSATFTLVPPTFSSIRRIRPFAWRIWAWGTFGFLAGYMVPQVVLLVILFLVGASVGRNPSNDDAKYMMAALFYTPPIAALVGGVLGAVIGYSQARRRVCSGADV